MDLDSLYQEIILDHYRDPHNAGLRAPFEAEVHHVNPTCGDEITLRVHLDGDQIVDVSYAAEGCIGDIDDQSGIHVSHDRPRDR